MVGRGLGMLAATGLGMTIAIAHAGADVTHSGFKPQALYAEIRKGRSSAGSCQPKSYPQWHMFKIRMYSAVWVTCIIACSISLTAAEQGSGPEGLPVAPGGHAPALAVQVKAKPDDVAEPLGELTFRVKIKNEGDTPLSLVSVMLQKSYDMVTRLSSWIGFRADPARLAAGTDAASSNTSAWRKHDHGRSEPLHP